jgi:hypothetical protein
MDPAFRSLDDDDQFTFRIAIVDLRAGERFNCARGGTESLRSRLNKDACDFYGMVCVAARRPATVDELTAVNVTRERCVGHSAPHFAGGPGGPLMA